MHFLDGLIPQVLSIKVWQSWWKHFHGQAVTGNFLWQDEFLVTPAEVTLTSLLLLCSALVGVCRRVKCVWLLLTYKAMWREESQDSSPIGVLWMQLLGSDQDSLYIQRKTRSFASGTTCTVPKWDWGLGNPDMVMSILVAFTCSKPAAKRESPPLCKCLLCWKFSSRN